MPRIRTLATSIAPFILFGASQVFLVSCGHSGGVGDKLRPQDTTANDAMKEQPSAIKACKPAPGEPLVVDLRSNERSDFEVAMQDGVAVVSYNCKELKLLKSCSLKGATYSFSSVTLKEDVVQMASKDEVEANIPISGAKLSAGLQSGSTLELALITVGKRRTPVKKVFADDLEGECEGATHVIRGAYLGAFAMGTGTSGQATAVAEMFGVGGGGSSTARRKATTKDGDLVACRKAEKNASAPPAECQAITRLDLAPIRPGGGGGHHAPPPPSEDPIANAEEPMPAPSSMGDSASSSTKGSSSRKPTKKPTKPSSKPPLKGSSASAAPPSPGAPRGMSASAASATEADEVEAPTACPEGFAWTGVMCKKK